jgi:hypothetical protein
MTVTTDAPQPLSTCPRCGCREFFIRKDFPQKLGFAIVVVAGVAFLALAASRQRFYLGVLVLIAAVVVDLVLYAIVPKITVCYRCRTEFRDVPLNPEHEGYELAVGEKYRPR